jgi:RecA/RadA recombinase
VLPAFGPMGSRLLTRVRGVTEEASLRCEEKGLRTCKQLLDHVEHSLRYELDMYPDDVEGLMLAASRATAPKPTTVWRVASYEPVSSRARRTTASTHPPSHTHTLLAQALLMRQRSECHALPTGMEGLDACLKGGVPPCTVTEVVGAPGVGKTQLSIMLSVLALCNGCRAAAAGKGGGSSGAYGVVYIDTESGFRLERALQIASARHPAISPDSIGSHLHYFRVSSTAELMKLLGQLEVLVIEHGIRLVVLDSAAALVRKEFGRESMLERQRVLAKQAALLKRIAEIFCIPVFVTNQMTTHRSAQLQQPRDRGGCEKGQHEEQHLTAALGNTWAHCVNTRLELQNSSHGKSLLYYCSPHNLPLLYFCSAHGTTQRELVTL